MSDHFDISLAVWCEGLRAAIQCFDLACKRGTAMAVAETPGLEKCLSIMVHDRESVIYGLGILKVDSAPLTEFLERPSVPAAVRAIATLEKARAEWLRVRQEAVAEARAASQPPADPQEDVPQPLSMGRLSLTDGGFEVGGTHYKLSGQPLAVLRALLLGRHRTRTANHIETETLKDAVEPRGAAGDAIKNLRKALRKAGIREPIETIGDGDSLAWKLTID